MLVNANKITTVVGKNFSGRTSFLKEKTGFQVEHSKGRSTNQFLGPDIANFLSGVAGTVSDEILLHGGKEALNVDEWLRNALSDLQFEDKLEQNPFTLSGGEQTLLTILTMLSIRSPSISLDCTLEQLSAQNRIKVFALLNRLEFLREALIADNRLNEFHGVEHYPRIELTPRGDENSIKLEQFIPYISPQNTIEIENLNFHYKGGKAIFSNASLTMNSGEILLLTGENGAGKSTFSKLMCGILKPDTGLFTANKVPFEPHENPSEYFAYHFQNPDLQLFASNVVDEVRLSARNKDDDNVLRLLRAFGLESHGHKHPMDLPFSLRKRLAMVVTIAMERPWIIFDEPTIGQDDDTIAAIANIFKAQANAGTGVLIISHSRDFLALFENKTIEVRDGKLACGGI